MRILLLSSSFFGYSKRVADNIRKCRHIVDEIYAYPVSYLDRILKKSHLKDYNRTIRDYCEKKYAEIKENQYDKIVVFGGGTPYSFIEMLKTRYSSSELVLYLSADMSSYGFSSDYLSLFDRKLSYSLTDSEIYGFEYRPWFYTDKKTSHKDIDVSFVGSIHPIRLDILEKINHYEDVSSNFYIYTDRLSYLKYFINWHNLRHSIHFTGLPYDAYIDVLSRSKATLDIPECGQNNITTRPIEALATNTKIITTNKNVVNYDFYCSENILIVDNNFNMEKMISWLNSPYSFMDNTILEKYNINSFVTSLLQINK